MVENVPTWSPTDSPQAKCDSFTAQVVYGPFTAVRLIVDCYAAQVCYNPTPSNYIKVDCFAFQICYRADSNAAGEAYPTYGLEDTAVIYHDLFFPRCHGYGGTSSPVYLTEKIEVDSGDEQRNSRRRYPRHEYKIAMDNLGADEIAEIMNLWHVCAGDFIGFLFLDPMDHTSANNASSITSETVSYTDQVVASALGTQIEYDLWKAYISNGRAVRRRIWYPDLDTLVVGVDGFEITSFVYSYDTHKLSFLRPFADFTGTLTRAADGTITGASFGNLKVGDLVYISGWSSPGYDALEGSSPARVVAVTGSTLRLQKFNGSAYGAAVMTSTVTIKQALPPTGADITAGFWFYVPVRFGDGDQMTGELKNGLRDSAIASFSDITLKEIAE